MNKHPQNGFLSQSYIGYGAEDHYATCILDQTT